MGAQGDDRPLTAGEFARLMAAFAPFEPAPHLAVAVSGGADSLALALLAAEWAAARGGTATALVVDHRLRPESGAEAERAAGWLAARGISSALLVWTARDRRGGIQAAARTARYRLLAAWCRERGVLHLLTAHHADDLAETLLLRLARGSGAFGLAGTAPLREVPACRVLRPLLGVAKRRLAATLAHAGQPWIEDPSNADPSFARVRFRRAAGVLAAEGLGPARLAATARNLGRARCALEAALARRLAEAVELHPAGFARVDLARLLAFPEETALRSLATVVACVGGCAYPPRLRRLERLAGALRAADGVRTLAGCRIEARSGRALVAREVDRSSERTTLAPGEERHWDGRFRIALRPRAVEAPLDLGPLGEAGWAALVAVRPELRACPVPAAARRSLPALSDAAGIVAVPTLGYGRDWPFAGKLSPAVCVFAPRRPLSGPEFALAWSGSDIIYGLGDDGA